MKKLKIFSAFLLGLSLLAIPLGMSLAGVNGDSIIPDMDGGEYTALLAEMIMGNIPTIDDVKTAPGENGKELTVAEMWENTSTNRLIVKTGSNEPLDEDCGAVSKIEGYRNLHIFQYADEQSAEAAFSYFEAQPETVYVEYDVYIARDFLASGGTPSYPPEGLDIVGEDWSADMVESPAANALISEMNLKKVKIALLDTGVDKNHPFFNTDPNNPRILPNNKFSAYKIFNKDPFFVDPDDPILDPNDPLFDPTHPLNDSSHPDHNYYLHHNYYNYSNLTLGALSNTKDIHGHGTHVAGIIVAHTLPNVKIKPYAVMWIGKPIWDPTTEEEYGDTASGIGYYDDNTPIAVTTFLILAGAVDDAVKTGCDIINMSFSWDCDDDDGDMPVAQTFIDSVNDAIDSGCVVVTSAGNSVGWRPYNIPAGMDNVITVASVDSDFTHSQYSNFYRLDGYPYIDLAAPGGDMRVLQEVLGEITGKKDIYSTWSRQSIVMDYFMEKYDLTEKPLYLEGSGTSMSAAVVSAAAATAIAVEPSLSSNPLAVKALLKKTVLVPEEWNKPFYHIEGGTEEEENGLPYGYVHFQYGVGVVNFKNMVDYLLSEPELIPKANSTTIIDYNKNFIYGLKTYLTESELKNTFLDVEGFGYFEVQGGTAGANNTVIYGTGATVTLYSDYDPCFEDVYKIVIYGDVNGDGKINSGDVSVVNNFTINSNSAPNLKDSSSPYFFAADLLKNGLINNNVVSILNKVATKMWLMDQQTGDLVGPPGPYIQAIPGAVTNYFDSEELSIQFLELGHTSTYLKGEKINYVYGLDTLAPTLDGTLAALNGGRYEVTYEYNQCATDSTGAKLTVYDENDEVFRTFFVVVFGDLDGDGAINSSDVSVMISAMNGTPAWAQADDPEDNPFFFAADLNHDGVMDADDLNILLYDISVYSLGYPKQHSLDPNDYFWYW
ncbi:MAG: S8 family serine peptidase [Oscillospiraceae bacterium]|nr:S8 family serine peptidase [Oscillospiraceae bacterium]